MRFWLTLILSVFTIFVLLDRAATALGSFRGEAGIQVAALTVAACLAAERWLWGQPAANGFRTLGLGLPAPAAVGAALGVGVLLLLVLPVLARLAALEPSFYPAWPSLLPGLFAQGGVAEEVLFRGYLFGTLRRVYSFRRAALYSTGPFLAAHLVLFATMSGPVALAATMLSLVVSFPLAHLYELGGRTIWAPALLHFFIQSPIKIVEMSGPAAAFYPLVWMCACAVIPWLVFLARVEAHPVVGAAQAALSTRE